MKNKKHGKKGKKKKTTRKPGKRLKKKSARKSKGRRKPESNSRMTTHHMIPRSRGGNNDAENKKRVALILHRAWHHLFDNCTPKEIIYGLQSPSKRDFFIRNNKDKKQDWQTLFGENSETKVIKIIKKEWSPLTPKLVRKKKQKQHKEKNEKKKT